MTKIIRVENADTNTEKVVLIEYFQKHGETGEMIFVRSERLDYPTFMSTITLWDGLEVRIKEITKP